MTDIGIQLFSLPKVLQQDFKAGIKMLAKMGYTNLELYGPYEFSAQLAKDSWNAITPMLGFSGSGYFGYNKKDVKMMLQDNDMSTHSVHTDLTTLEDHMDALAEAGQYLGFKYVALPAIPPELRTNVEDYKRIGERFNKIGENAKSKGLKFAYHNHGYGLQESDGVVPFEYLMEITDPNLVFLEMDIYWTTAGGVNPIDYLEKYKDRYQLMHVKDMKEHKTFAGDGGDPSQWIELFPFMATCGKGVLELDKIIAKGKEVGVKHFLVEQDMVQSPEIALAESHAFLSKL